MSRKVIGMASIGRNARVSNFKMTAEQTRDLDDISRLLEKLFNAILPGWNTYNIEVVSDE